MHSPNINPAKRAQAARQQAGYTIVELSIAVAIAGVLLVSAIGLVQNVLQTNRANETVSILARAMSQINKTWADQASYAGLELGQVVASGALEGMTINRAADGTVAGVVSAFNRAVYAGVAANVPEDNSNRGFSITFAGIPSGVCSDLVTSASAAGVQGILVTPEATVAATKSVIIPTKMDESGKFTEIPTGSVNVMDGSMLTPNLTAALGVGACGTNNATVGVSFLGWK